MEDSNKFINQSDPTSLLDLSSVTLQEQYAKLTESEKIMVGAKILGMNHIPVPIKTFLFDDYFLGSDNITNHGKSIFKFWLDKFDGIFPNPILTKTPYISFGGAIGTGKSFMSKTIGLYFYHRLDCCSNVYTSLGLAGGTKLAMGFFHANFETAKRDFVNFYKFVFDESPYFKRLYNNPPIRLIASGPKSTGAVLGSQLIYCVLSELGFWRPQDAVEKVEEVLGRYESRFKNKRTTFGAVVADSSAKDEDFSACKKFEESVPGDELFKINPSQWEVRPELYAESKGKTFKFYRGDSIREPYCIENDKDIENEHLDKDRIINVPISAKYRFLSDPVRSLRDLAGYSYSGNELFFNNNLSHLLNCCTIRNLAPEIITVDFYNKQDSIFDKVSQMVYRIPRGTNLFVHYDIGIKKDICGIALCYYNGDKVIGNAVLPKFKFPLVFGVSRLKGQATSLDHLYQFLKDLIKNGYYITFSADSFASAGIFQSCERDGIDYKAISVDKTMDAGTMFKNIVNTERAELPYNNVLLRECSEIKIVSNGKNGDHIKLDHPLVSKCTEFDYAGKTGELPGTKDIFDACCGALYSCYQKYAEYKEGGVNSGIQRNIKAIDHITKDSREETAKKIQSMMESIF